jgi:hypothetical protein
MRYRRTAPRVAGLEVVWRFCIHPIMKTIALTTLSLILGATVFAEPLQVEIAARYEGFDRAQYAEIGGFEKEGKGGNLLSSPRVTTKSGQRAMIEIIREIQVPETPMGETTVNAGISLDVSATVNDGQISLSGKSVLRRRLAQASVQPIAAISFATHETFFGGVVRDGEELTIAVGDGPKDEARIILTVRLLTAKGAPAK